jgi:Brp/Blh family beta-carotene 15,15'-monooxygenase
VSNTLTPPLARLAPVAAERSRRLGLGALGTVLVLGFVPGALDGSFAWVLLAAGLLVGLPHGAVDHLVPEWLLGRRLPPLRAAAMLGAYIAVAGAFFGLLRVAPLPSALVFLVVSAAHFGAGDVEFHALRRGQAPRRRPVAVAAFGLPPIALPLAVHAEAVEPVLVALAPGLAGLVTAPVRALLAVITLAAVAHTLWRAWSDDDRQLAGELLLLVAVFVVAPPLAAFAAYFGFWHAARHVARLLSLDPRNDADLEAGQLLPPLGRFARSAALPTVASVVVLIGLWWGAGGVEGLVSAHLGLLAALTMPHVAVVSWLDRTGRPSQRTGAGA